MVTGNENVKIFFFSVISLSKLDRFISISNQDENDQRYNDMCISSNTFHQHFAPFLWYLSVCLSVCLSHTIRSLNN